MPPGRLREIAVARLGAEPVSTLHARADAAEAAGAISARRASRPSVLAHGRPAPACRHVPRYNTSDGLGAGGIPSAWVIAG
jgi:hypothetical protein